MMSDALNARLTRMKTSNNALYLECEWLHSECKSFELGETQFSELKALFAELGHPIAPGETIDDKIRNLCAIIKAQRELLEDV